MRTTRFVSAVVAGLLSVACATEQQFGSSDGPSDPDAPLSFDSSGKAGAGRVPEWLNPRMGAAMLRAVWGTSSNDVWFVGDAGTVIHWNGEKATKQDVGNADGTFFTVWASGRNDVWIAGDTGAGGPSVVRHWDGKTWSGDFKIAEEPIHSVWGLDADNVFWVTESTYQIDGEIGRVYAQLGGKLVEPCSPGGSDFTEFFEDEQPLEGEQDVLPPSAPPLELPRLRDVWGADADNVWVVGDEGTLAQVQVGSCVGPLFRRLVAADSPIDPYSSDINYIGIWGRDANDVSALFVGRHGVAGLAHWDGRAWRADERGDSNYPVWIGELPSGPLRHGHLLFGVDDALVQIGIRYLQFFSFDSAIVSPLNWYIFNSPSRSPTAGGLGTDNAGNLYLAGEFGAALWWNPSAGTPSWSHLWDKGPPMDLSAVAPVSSDNAYALGGGTGVAHWDGTSWSSVAEFERFGPGRWNDVGASSLSNVWVVGVGENNDGRAAHFDGVQWLEMLVENEVELTSVWTIDDESAWAAGNLPSDTPALGSREEEIVIAFRWDSERWQTVEIEKPRVESCCDTGSPVPSIFASSARDAFIVKNACCALHVWRWNEAQKRFDRMTLPTSLSDPRNASFALGGQTDIWGSNASDLWVADPLARFDGRDWIPELLNGELPLSGISGTAKNDVWMIGEGLRGGVIRFWNDNSQRFEKVLETPVTLSGIGRDDSGQIWFVGEGGATLRLPALERLR